jgi:hypothetical protein
MSGTALAASGGRIKLAVLVAMGRSIAEAETMLTERA